MKTRLGAKNLLFPNPTILVGAMVDGKANYITVAHCGIVAVNHIAISLRKGRYTSSGIKENGTFSVNIPSAEMVTVTDYCGLVFGKNVDKSKLFETFFGTLQNAPMIRSCPVNMECRVTQTLEFPSHEVFIGEVIETHCDEKYMTDGVLDLAKVQPILYGPNAYYSVGEPFGKPFTIGKQMKTT